MKSFAESLLLETDQKLELIQESGLNKTNYAEEKIKVLIAALEKLKSFIIKYNFAGKSEEIAFFRDTKPQFAGRLIHYNEVYNIETKKPVASTKTLVKYYRTEIQNWYGKSSIIIDSSDYI